MDPYEEYELAYCKLIGDPGGGTGWNHPSFREVRQKIEETIRFQTWTPEELQDGVEQCPKCGSFKTLSQARQTRSADEGATVFTQCLVCKKRTVKNS